MKIYQNCKGCPVSLIPSQLMSCFESICHDLPTVPLSLKSFFGQFSKHFKMLRSRIFSNMDSRSKRPPQSRGPPARWIVIEQCMKYRAESVERSFGNHCLSIQEYSTQQCSAEQLIIVAQEQIIILLLTFLC